MAIRNGLRTQTETALSAPGGFTVAWEKSRHIGSGETPGSDTWIVSAQTAVVSGILYRLMVILFVDPVMSWPMRSIGIDCSTMILINRNDAPSDLIDRIVIDRISWMAVESAPPVGALFLQHAAVAAAIWLPTDSRGAMAQNALRLLLGKSPRRQGSKLHKPLSSELYLAPAHAVSSDLGLTGPI